MKFKEWIENIIDSGYICGEYADKAIAASSKKKIMDIVLDVNGSSFLQEMKAKGAALPYETIEREFSAFINGRYVAEFRNEKGNGYTSKMYCQHQEPILVDTTLCSILGCKCDVVIKKNNFAQLYVDSESEIRIILEEGAQVLVDIWKGAQVSTNDEKRTKVTIH